MPQNLSAYGVITPPPSSSDNPDLLILAFEGAPLFYYSLWKVGNQWDGTIPQRFTSTVISSSFGPFDYLADPYRSFDSDTVVYCRVGQNLTPKRTSIRTFSWDDDSDNTEIYAETTTGAVLSLEPSWRPDDAKILFRSGTALDTIKDMDPDGSNVRTLYTGGSLVDFPTYSWDGTRIAFVEYPALKVMDADGSNVSTLYTSSGFYNPTAPTWAYASLKIAFQEGSGIYTDDTYWKTINDDGSGLTTIFTQSRSVGFGPSDHDPYALPWTWLPDDSGIITTVQVPSDPDPNHYLVFIDAGGGGASDFTTPPTALPVGTPDYRPAVITVPERGVPRVFYADGELWSLAVDGTDLLQEGGIPTIAGDPIFHGFRGDTVNI